MKRLFAFSSIITFLFTAFVFTSCSNIFEDKSDSGELVIQIPSEKSARAAADYDSYDFTISITNRDTKANQTKQGKPGQSCSFELEGGFYNIKISASDSSEPDTVLFEGEATDVEVIPGQTTEVPVITLKRLSRTWTIDLSDYIKYIQINYNKWGGPNYESDNVDITNSFNGSLPKAGDTLNFTWKAKSDIDIDKIGMHIANIDFIGKGPGEWVKWTHLISPEKWDTVAASNIKAGQEFEINVSYVLDETPENNVKFTLWYSEEVGASAMLYTGEKPDLKPVEIKIEDGVIKFTKPGKENLEQLISKGCNGYIVGIVSGENEDGNPDWIFGKLIYLNDKKAFEDLNCNLELITSANRIKENKIYPILDFYKNVSFDESEREFIDQYKGPEVEYIPDPEIVLPIVKLESETIKITPPSEKYLKLIKEYECTSYATGIVEMTNDTGAYNWLFGKNVKLDSNDVFKDVDLTLEFGNNYSKIGDNKLAAVIHFYKGNIDKEDEREYITDIVSSPVTYVKDSELTPPSLEVENVTVKITAPGTKFLEALTAANCDGYIVGIASGLEDPHWLVSRKYNFSDNDAFGNVNFSSDFTSDIKADIKNGKIFPIIDFYKNVNSDSKVWVFQIRGEEADFVSDGSLSPAEAINAIPSITESTSLKISGEATEDQIKSIGVALGQLQSNNDPAIELDMRDITGITKIPYQAFYYIACLKSVKLPSCVTELCDYAFAGCGLTSIELPSTLQTIGNYALIDCSYITSISIPASVTSIGEGAFGRTAALSTITVSEQNENYKVVDNVLFSMDGKELIRYPSQLEDTSYSVPSGVEIIAYDAFSDCKNVQMITLPEGVTTIGKTAFAWSPNLVSINIPSTVNSIDWSPFKYCYKLESISVASGNSKYCSDNDILFEIDGDRNKIALIQYPPSKNGESYTIPNTVKTIEASAFNFAINLSSVTIGTGVETIKFWAFDGVYRITEIIIPANVTTLESGVFVESSITNISFEVTTGWKYRDRSSGNMVDVTEDELQKPENYIGWQSIFGNTELTRSE